MDTRITHFTEYVEKYSAITEVLAALEKQRHQLVEAMIELLSDTGPKEKAEARLVINSLSATISSELLEDPSLSIELGIRRHTGVRRASKEGPSNIL